VAGKEARWRADLEAVVNVLADDRRHHGCAAVEHAQENLAAVDLLFRRGQNLPDPTLDRSDHVGCSQNGVARLLLSELIGEADHALVAFRQGISERADLLLKLVGAPHVARTVAVSDADKYAAVRRRELNTYGFEPLLRGRLQFLRDRAVPLGLVQLGPRQLFCALASVGD
jgi:hypothetical protein